MNPAHALDIGEIDGPLLAFGGPYSNLEATRAVLDAARGLGIPAGRIVCTGDVCAYGADPQDTADLVRRSGIHVVMGNCDENLGNRVDSCGCGFGADTACDLLSRQWYAHADAHLDERMRAWMRGLPRAVAFRMAGRAFRVVHGGTDRINRFVYASTPDAELRAEVEAAGTDAVIAGHCGIPFVRQIDGGRAWINPGVVGLPANDGTPRTWYAVLSPFDGGVRVEIRPLAYDVAVAAAKMHAHGLPAGYADALETGLWPSLDSLPQTERGATGRPLEPVDSLWPAPARADRGLSPLTAT